MRVRFPYAILFVLPLFGCNRPYTPSTPPAIFDLEIRKAAVEAQQHDLVMEGYRQWQSEVPQSCDSPSLMKARSSALFVASITTPERQGFDSTLHAGVWVLDIADGAREKGCSVIAKDMYNQVIRIYVGTGYSGLRDRALLGLSSLK